jgi:hypothetical protein
VPALQAGRGLAAQRFMMTRTYDLAKAKVRASRAAGMKTQASPESASGRLVDRPG